MAQRAAHVAARAEPDAGERSPRDPIVIEYLAALRAGEARPLDRASRAQAEPPPEHQPPDHESDPEGHRSRDPRPKEEPDHPLTPDPGGRVRPGNP